MIKYSKSTATMQTPNSIESGITEILATLIPPAVFSLGAAGGRVYQMIAANNFSPGNVRLVLPSDIISPLVGFLFLWLAYRHPKSEAGDHTQTWFTDRTAALAELVCWRAVLRLSDGVPEERLLYNVYFD
jgi:hypothetical protein